MRVHSIRWRLTLSYAAIACLAALASGAVLIGILRGYYAEKERAYLLSNTESFKALISSAMAEDVPVSALQPQLENLAFISKVRIRVLDDQNQELVDTGVPRSPYMISFIYTGSDQLPGDLQIQSIKLDPLTETVSAEGSVIIAQPAVWHIPLQVEALKQLPVFKEFSSKPLVNSSIVLTDKTIVTGNTGVNAVSVMPLSSTLYGFALGSAGTDRMIGQDVRRRSDQRINSPLLDANQNQIGAIILSDGPAYGREIVASVAWGWLIAGGIAILLAAVAGWFVSRQISKPLLALTDVTAHMTAGDLSTRANIARQDELGVLAQSFNTMADRIQDTVITLQRFVADAAHELHTPLTALRTNLELARGEHPSTAICRAHEQVIRLEKLTDGLLALSRLEARSDSTPTEPVDLNWVIRSASEFYASRAEQSELEFDLTLPGQLPPVIGRADQLECAISNLVDNAIKFTPEGGSVSLGVHQCDRALQITVRDTGIGIPPDDLPLLFERFRRAHNASNHPGSGLGLAITKAIVKAHGGAIVAESGHTGTQFTVTLPCVITKT